MILTANFSRWLVSAIALLHSALFLVIVYFPYGFERTFDARDMPFLTGAILFLLVAFFILTKRRWARVPSAIAFGGVIIWFLFDSTANDAFEWRGLLWFLPALLALGLLSLPPTRLVERLT